MRLTTTRGANRSQVRSAGSGIFLGQESRVSFRFPEGPATPHWPHPRWAETPVGSANPLV